MPKTNSNQIPLIPRDLSSLFPLSLFRSHHQTRDLEEWERGYWRIDLFSWRGEEKVEFWRKMKKAVESGRFGFIYVLFDVPSPPWIFLVPSYRIYFLYLLSIYISCPLLPYVFLIPSPLYISYSPLLYSISLFGTLSPPLFMPFSSPYIPDMDRIFRDIRI